MSKKSKPVTATPTQPERVYVETVDNRVLAALRKLKTASAAVAGLPSLDVDNDSEALAGITDLINDAYGELHTLQFLPSDVRQSPAPNDEDHAFAVKGDIVIEPLPSRREEDEYPPLDWTPAAEAAERFGGAR